jgi:flagellar protein FliO/FliZ
MKARRPRPIVALLLLPALALAGTGAPAYRSPDGWAGNGLLQLVAGLFAILALLAAGAWFLRRYTPLRTGEGTIKVISGLALGARERMVLVEVGEVRLLVGIAPGRLQTLHVFEASSGAGPLAPPRVVKPKPQERGYHDG